MSENQEEMIPQGPESENIPPDQPTLEAQPAEAPSPDELSGSADASRAQPVGEPPAWSERPALRLAVNVLAVCLVAILGLLLVQRFAIGSREKAASPSGDRQIANAAVENSSGEEVAMPTLPPFLNAPPSYDAGVFRRASLDTVIPSRPRSEVITYTVKPGDNLFLIAENYGLKPETVLWGNFETLKDNPQMLSPEQVLNILPEDGVYYQWQEGDTVDSVASFFKVEPQAILEYTGNQIDLTETVSGTYGIEPGAWLIIPGGQRELKDWGPPAISRTNPASAAYYGPGSCGAVYEGAIGYGTFVWPTTEHFISGYNYSAIHRGIDIGGSIGNSIFAADSGVVVYAGWSNFGYGNLIVVDHGNGWQTAYAHLNTIAVRCGQSVGQGTFIGGLGSTGNSSGPHLHFEIVFNGAKPNPLDFVQ